MCERCSLRWKAEIFVSPDTRLAAAVLRQSWWGSVVGRDLVWGWVGGWSCLWVHEWDVCGFKGSFCSQAMLKVIYWIWSSYFSKDIEINVWYKMLPDCLLLHSLTLLLAQIIPISAISYLIDAVFRNPVNILNNVHFSNQQYKIDLDLFSVFQ